MQVHQLRLIGPQPFPQLGNVVFNLAFDFRRFRNFVAYMNVHASVVARTLSRSRWSPSARAIEPGKEQKNFTPAKGRSRAQSESCISQSRSGFRFHLRTATFCGRNLRDYTLTLKVDSSRSTGR